MDDRELFELVRSCYAEANQEYLIQQIGEAMKHMPKRYKQRKKMYMRYLLKQWSAHKFVKVRYDMIQETDWYRIIEIIKRGGPDWYKL